MVSITVMNLYSIDLNLLAVLHAVLEERSATRAARKLHVTQSAVSNALARLRQVLGDPLVVRSGRGIVPTPRGAELGPAIAAAMSQLDAALDRGRGFVAAESTRTFTFAAADNTQVTDVPKIAALFAKELPGATLRVVSADYLVATDGLATGTVDATISPAASLPEGARTAPVLPERAALLVREGHPLSGQRVTPKMYASMGHIDIEIALGRTGVGHKLAMEELRRLGLERNVAVRVPYFSTAALIASKTDLVASVPRRAAEIFVQMLPLRILETVFPLRPMAMSLVWHERTHEDPGAKYFRGLVLRAILGDAEGRAKRRPARERRQG
jgi:DNA-binding transcriptional LysR family regulator